MTTRRPSALDWSTEMRDLVATRVLAHTEGGSDHVPGTPADVDAFAEACHVLGLDPFANQIYRPDRLVLITCDSLDGICRRVVSGADLAANFVWHADRQANAPGSRKTAA